MSMTREEFIEKHFPDVDPGREPLGNKITVQLMHVQAKSAGGIVLVEETRDFNKEVTIVARVVKVGPIAYKDRGTGDTWKEGAWASVGDLVLVHKYGGQNRARIPMSEGSEENIIFCTYNDYDVLDRITGHYEVYSKIL